MMFLACAQKLQAAAVGLCASGGLSVAVAFNQLLYDPTWSISTGIGALMAVLVYEIGQSGGRMGKKSKKRKRDDYSICCWSSLGAGRPKRISLEEVERREALSADFMAFVEEKLSVGSLQRCHVSDLQVGEKARRRVK